MTAVVKNLTQQKKKNSNINATSCNVSYLYYIIFRYVRRLDWKYLNDPVVRVRIKWISVQNYKWVGVVVNVIKDRGIYPV